MREAEAGPRGPVVIVAFDDAAKADYFAVASELRRAGIAAEVYLGRSGLKAQMKYADRRMSPAAILIGGDELAAGADVETWRSERPGQFTVPRAEMVEAVRRIVDGKS